MESSSERELMLEAMGEQYQTLNTTVPITFRLIPGKSHHVMADYHSPYDAEVERYLFVTTEEEVAFASLKTNSKFKGLTTGREFTILNISPDETQWAVILATWDSPNIAD